MKLEDIVKPLIVSPTGFHCDEGIYLSSNYYDADIERQVKRYNKKLIEEGVDCVLKDLERFGTWKSLLFNGYWIKNFTILENLLDWYVFDANTIEFFIKEANKYSLKSKLPYQDTNIVTNDYWTIYIYNSLDINGDKVPDIGPSWK